MIITWLCDQKTKSICINYFFEACVYMHACLCMYIYVPAPSGGPLSKLSVIPFYWRTPKWHHLHFILSKWLPQKDKLRMAPWWAVLWCWIDLCKSFFLVGLCFLIFPEFQMSNITNAEDFLIIKWASLFKAFLILAHEFTFPRGWERENFLADS